MLTWLLLVVVISVAEWSESRVYEDHYYVEGCPTQYQVDLTVGSIARVWFTKKLPGEQIILEKATNYGCDMNFQYANGDVMMGLHLVGSDTMPSSKLDHYLREYFPVDKTFTLDYTIQSGHKTMENIGISHNNYSRPRSTSEITDVTEISFKLTGDYIYNNVMVPNWRIVHMIWSVDMEIYDEVTKTPPIPLRKNCRAVITHDMSDPTTSYIHHHENPIHIIDIDDCRVDIETSNDSYALQYKVVHNATDVYQYMTNETITMSYKATYNSDYQVFRTYKANDSIPAMLDLPLPDNKTGVYGIRYDFSTNGVKRALFAGFVFTVSTIIDPEKVTEEPTTQESTTDNNTTEEDMGGDDNWVLKQPKPQSIPVKRRGEEITKFPYLILVYILVAIFGLIAIVSLAAYLSNWKNNHWHQIRHNQFDTNTRNHTDRIYGDKMELKSADMVTRHA